jgi:hypothetical protein
LMERALVTKGDEDENVGEKLEASRRAKRMGWFVRSPGVCG